MRWEQTHIEGEGKVGRKEIIKFKSKEVLNNIRSLSSSCKCSTPTYNKETKELIVSYDPGNIPVHLRSQGYYMGTKTITVTYEDGYKDYLSFTYKISK